MPFYQGLWSQLHIFLGLINWSYSLLQSLLPDLLSSIISNSPLYIWAPAFHTLATNAVNITVFLSPVLFFHYSLINIFCFLALNSLRNFPIPPVHLSVDQNICYWTITVPNFCVSTEFIPFDIERGSTLEYWWDEENISWYDLNSIMRLLNTTTLPIPHFTWKISRNRSKGIIYMSYMA